MNDPLATKDTYDDNDLVYVDPEKRIVLGLVQWNTNGKPKPLPVPELPSDGSAASTRKSRNTFYPWGTYRSMKHVWKLEGKVLDSRPMITLEKAIELALKEPFWD